MKPVTELKVKASMPCDGPGCDKNVVGPAAKAKLILIVNATNEPTFFCSYYCLSGHALAWTAGELA